MDIIIFGGSFNPIHFGHIGLAKWVLTHTPADEVWLMVSPNNPLKEASTLADEQARFAQVQQAVEEANNSLGATLKGEDPHKRLRASDFEFGLPRPSYTADTLRELQRTYPRHRFSLLIGEDNLKLFTRWREWQFILQNFTVYVYPRHGSTNDPVNLPTAQAQIIYLHDAPYFDISSTEIREKQKK